MTEESRLCHQCGITKPFSAFYKRNTADGRVLPQGHCKICQYAYVKAWNDKNREKVRFLNRKQKHPYIVHKKDACERCGFIPEHACQLDVDHIDDNHKNNDPTNLQTLCANCHRLKSRAQRMKDKVEKDYTLALYDRGK